MAALIPPAAATEWLRTGWTFDRIATVAPARAAARAARWPARPAPMMSTSWAGILPGLYYELPCGSDDRAGRRAGQRAGDLLDGDHAAEHPLGVDRQQRAELAQA